MAGGIESKADLLKIAGAFREADILFTGFELGVFDALAAGPMTADGLARKLALSRRGAEILLNALAAMRLLLKRAGKFSLAPVAEKHLISGAPDSMAGALGHASSLRRAWIDLPIAVKTGKPVPKTDAKMGKSAERRHRDFIMAMHDHARADAEKLAETVGLDGVKKVLDAGGGPGTYLFAMIRRKPDITGAVFDLPQTIKITREMIALNGMQRSVGTIEGDFLTDDFGGGFDFVLMSSILHINSPAENQRLVRKGFNALNPGGRLAIKEFMLDDSKTSPADAAIFSVNMLVNTDKGASYTRREIRSWLEKAGFTGIRTVELPPRAALMIGTRPKTSPKSAVKKRGRRK